MLARTDRILPLEIYSSIFSSLKYRDLVQLSQVCNILFNATIPHIWREVRLTTLLALLPGSRLADVVHESEDPAPTISPDDYCARFTLYAPHVKILKIQDGAGHCTPSMYFMNHRAKSTLDRIKLPALEEADVHYLFYSMDKNIYRQSSLLWIIYMFPPVLKSLSFTAGTHEDLPVLSAILTKCPRLSQLKFSPDQVPNWDTWRALSSLTMAQELTNLEVRCAELSADGYSWLSQLPKLRCLKLHLGQHYGLLPQPSASSNYSSAAYSHAFSALRSLHISVGDEDEPQCIMRIWETIGMHITQVTVEKWNRIRTLGMFSQIFSSLVTNCPKVSFFHLHEYVPSVAGIEGDAPWLPVSHLSTLRRLPLRVLRIDHPLALNDGCGAMESVGTLFPELEELWLENTPITMEDLLQANVYFPCIRRLRLCLHTVKRTSEPLSAIIDDTNRSFGDTYIPDSNLALELHTGGGLNGAQNSYDAADWDFAASLFAARWSSVSVIQSWDGMLFRHFFKIEEKIAFHLAQQAKGRR